MSGVTVSPKTATVGKDGTLQFSAGATGTNSPSQTVAWSITTGGTKTGTSISASGLLTVAEDQTKTSLEIKAVSSVDTGKSDTAAVSVIEAQPPVPIGEFADHVAGLSANTPESLHTVKLKRTNITTNSVMTLVNQGVTNRYVILDLSDCYATDNTISGRNSSNPRLNDMNVIKDNQYIVGIILPGELTTIGNYAFSGCSSLVSVTFVGSNISWRDFSSTYSFSLAICATSF